MFVNSCLSNWPYTDFMALKFHIQKTCSFFAAYRAYKYIFLPILILPTASRAEDNVISRFTQSIATVYSTSKACEKTIAPGPQEYITLITAYFNGLYPNGTGYWVVPAAEQRISNPVTCIRLMQSRLFDYKNARKDYHANYPERNPPPILIAYKWDSAYIQPPPKAPARSYTPSYTPPVKQKFYSTLPNLQ